MYSLGKVQMHQSTESNLDYVLPWNGCLQPLPRPLTELFVCAADQRLPMAGEGVVEQEGARGDD